MTILITKSHMRTCGGLKWPTNSSVASDVPGPSLVSSNKTTEDICEPLVPPPFDDGDAEHGIQQGSEHKIEVSQAQVCQREDTEDSSLHLTPKDWGARWYVISKGTMAYKPPEYIQSSSFHGEPLMVWLLGILLFNMVFWRNPKKEDLYSVSEMEQTQGDLSDGELMEGEIPDEEAVIVVEPASPAFMMPLRQEPSGLPACELEDETEHIEVKEVLKSKPNKALSLFLWPRKNFRKVKTSGYCDENDDGISEGSVASDVPGPSLVSSNKTTEDICEPLVPPPFDDGDGEQGIQQGSEHKIEVSQAQVCQREDTEDSSLHLTPKDWGARWYVISKGTMAYKPPEYIQSSSFHGEPLMVWLLGILLFNMVFWRNPKKEDLYSVSEMEQTQGDLSDGELMEGEIPDEEAVIVVEPASPAFMMPLRQEPSGLPACDPCLLPDHLEKKKKTETEIFCPSSEGELEDETEHIEVKEVLKSKPNKALSLFLWPRKNFRKVKVTRRSGEKKSC
ncbi:hypothetical protein DNTS_005544 [Danionella cerebrum]|uniref:non-specific serine/threonine protein kinase n=1 Tax=Danionella cerebrum TaxID=2873325 RepID=A0A553NJT0_9TELE|nr:hypothetical protein DNTS_005544 [Danionella translucida]